jgi:hypothetical protein
LNYEERKTKNFLSLKMDEKAKRREIASQSFCSGRFSLEKEKSFVSLK